MRNICYLGDDTLAGAAVYMAGIMTHFGMDFDRVNSLERPTEDFCNGMYRLYILSDYASELFTDGQIEYIAAAVEHGAGLIMFGGWESYRGLNGFYNKTLLRDVLPVLMDDQDDRRNYAQPCVILPTVKHPITEGLPWNSPPCIGGFNSYKPKPDAQVIMEIRRFGIEALENGGCCSRCGNMRNGNARVGNDWQLAFKPIETLPLLTVGTFGKGRVAALATDVAPHWVGGFVDWGRERLRQTLATGEFIDVGADYAQFFSQLVNWAIQK